jgi:hypothetical protein
LARLSFTDHVLTHDLLLKDFSCHQLPPTDSIPGGLLENPARFSPQT